MSRQTMSQGKDKKVFRNTAVNTKKINLSSGQVYRGGIRL